jgi:hypothetical protein
MNSKTLENTNPPIQNPDPVANQIPRSTSPARRRSGKIARLPQELRVLLNLMLRDGAPYSRIIEKLAERGHHLNSDNLSRWHAGGYQDWLQDQAWLEEMRLRLDFASEILRDPNGPMLEAACLRIAITQLYNLITTFEPSVLKPQMASQPGSYSRILNALCNLTQSALKCERRRSHQLSPTREGLLHHERSRQPGTV